MALGVIPVIGSAGFYEFQAPFDVHSALKIEYTCKAIRRISDYLANNESVQEEIYTAQGIESAWEEDSKVDSYIVSLQSATGHWLYIPSRYILSYPSVNGEQYRSMMIGISLPALPVTQDLSAIMEDVKDIVETSLGVDVVLKAVETSKVTMVNYEKHMETQTLRESKITNHATLGAKLIKLKKENDALLQKVAQLEQFILMNHT